MNPLARFVSQAEAGLGDATHRLLDSVTDPLRVKGQVMAAEATAAASRLVKLVVIKAALGVVAAAMAIVAIVYLVAALHQYLLPILGPVETRLAMAGVFLVIAAVAGVVMVFWPSSAPAATPTLTAAEAHSAMAKTEAAATAKAAKARVKLAEAEDAADTARDEAGHAAGQATASLRSGVESLAGMLGAAGFRKEQAGLRAGLALANQLKPMQLVSLALIGGFLAGMRSPRR